jgi:hypothetical protein
MVADKTAGRRRGKAAEILVEGADAIRISTA